MQLPKVHWNTFVYVTAFLKELLNNSDMNKMDAKLLGELEVTIMSSCVLVASLFGPVILRASRGSSAEKSKRTLSSEKKRKVAFLYQCLVNDL